MKVSKEMKKAEAIKRMKKMGLFDEAIKQFEEDDLVNISEPQEMFGYKIGALYWLDDEQKRIVKVFEEEYNALVYLVVRSYTNFGLMDNIFYVSDYKDEWFMDNTDLDENYASVYVINHDMPDCSEFGNILWKEASGGILRVFGGEEYEMPRM